MSETFRPVPEITMSLGSLVPACFSVKTPGTELGIPVIILILTGFVGQVSVANSRAVTGVVRVNLIRGWALACVSAPKIVMPQVVPP